MEFYCVDNFFPDFLLIPLNAFEQIQWCSTTGDQHAFLYKKSSEVNGKFRLSTQELRRYLPLKIPLPLRQLVPPTGTTLPIPLSIAHARPYSLVIITNQTPPL